MKKHTSMLPPYLVCVDGDRVTEIVHIEDGAIIFMEERLKNIMQKYGIQIPPGQRKDFEGKSVVYLQDRLFERAFREVYFHLQMPKDLYVWNQNLLI